MTVSEHPPLAPKPMPKTMLASLLRAVANTAARVPAVSP
jgi:hypothetical protein